jgi:glyoxylase-like metal-dependent hydrolase (beta-lactamase superfamily II)
MNRNDVNVILIAGRVSMLEDGFADIIGKARYGKAWSLSELERRSGVSEARIAALEAEATPEHNEITSLGSSLGLDCGKLQEIAEASWEPGIRPPYLVDPDLSTSPDMVHVIDGKIGSYPVKGYFFIDWKRKECLLFDTGYSPSKVITFLKQKALRLVAICLTHSHPDHIGGIEKIQSHVEVPVYLHRNEDLSKISLKQQIHVEDKMSIEIGRFKITARFTPGHTDGGTTYFIDLSPLRSSTMAFVGDALFAGSIGRAKSSKTYPTLLDSVKNIILSFPPETLLFPGHGPVTTSAGEKAHNPFFK